MQFGPHGFCQICQTVLNSEFEIFISNSRNLSLQSRYLLEDFIGLSANFFNRSFNGLGHILSSPFLITANVEVTVPSTNSMVRTFLILRPSLQPYLAQLVSWVIFIISFLVWFSFAPSIRVGSVIFSVKFANCVDVTTVSSPKISRLPPSFFKRSSVV